MTRLGQHEGEHGRSRKYRPRVAALDHGDFALICAVLEDALKCFQHQLVPGSKREQRLAQEAEEWLFEDDGRWPFSFVNICSALDLSPERVRLGLARWRHRASFEQHSWETHLSPLQDRAKYH